MKCESERERERVEWQEWGNRLLGGKATKYSIGRRELNEARWFGACQT